jgi:hypothetical protein
MTKTKEQIIINIDKHLQFKISTEGNNLTNYLDLSIHRNNNNIDIGIYRKPTCTDSAIQFSSNHPYEHKLASFNYYINRMTTLPITEPSKQQEWKVILTIARNNGFPAHIIHDLKKKLITKKQKHDNTTIQQNKKWITFTYHSPPIRKVTNLFKQTNLNITFQATNTMHQQLTEKPAHKNHSGIHKLKCNTCNDAYIGQSGRSITVGHKEHVRCVRTNIPISAYALHILNNKHEYGTAEETLELLKSCHKGTQMNCWETFYMQALHQHKLLINKQQISDINPLYELADTSRIPLQRNAP